MLQVSADDGQDAKRDTAPIKRIKQISSTDQLLVELQKQLCDWRNTFSIQQAKIEGKANTQQLTMGILCSGGCLDTLVGMRAKFKAVWSSEISASQARMFEDLTRDKCLGDTFGKQVWSAKRVDYIKSGQPAQIIRDQDLN